MDVPAEIQMRATIKCGSVFYFIEESFVGDKPHYFVVLNRFPLLDDGLILICAVSLDMHVIERVEQLGYERVTLVDVTPEQCALFQRPTLFDCNTVITKPMGVLIQKLRNQTLRRCTSISEELLEKLREGVLQSRQVSEKVKKLVR
ncbi:MAG: hypothetical protein WCT24_02000 [Patescibacteria group bacterium]|jgi:hypothetical protein